MVHARRKMGKITCDFGTADWASNDGNVPAPEGTGISVRWGMHGGSRKIL